MKPKWLIRAFAGLLTLFLIAPHVGMAEERILSQTSSTLPRDTHEIEIQLGAPFPVIWALFYNYGLTEGIDIGVNGSYFAASGHFGTVGGQAKFRLWQGEVTALAVSVTANYFDTSDVDGFMTNPALRLTHSFAENHWLLEIFVGTYIFAGDFGLNCFFLCGTLTGPNHVDVYLGPGVGLNVSIAKHWDFFIKGYPLLHIENGRLAGGGFFGFAAHW